MFPCKLLIIDDDKDDVEMLTDALHHSGFDNFHCVCSAAEAADYLGTCLSDDTLPRLIVTDLYLPGENGLQFINSLQKDERYNKIAVIVFSSLRFDMVRDFHKNFNEDYIEKPSSYQDYLKVADFLNRKSVA